MKGFYKVALILVGFGVQINLLIENCAGAEISKDVVITSPKDGFSIAPHHLLKITVNADSHRCPQGVSIASINIMTSAHTKAPYEFLILIPADLGPRELTAIGLNAGGSSLFSKGVTFNVENTPSAHGLSSKEDLGTLDQQSPSTLKKLAFDRAQEEPVRVGAILRLGKNKVPGVKDDLEKCTAADQPRMIKMAAQQALEFLNKK